MTKTESLEDNPDISPGFPLHTHLHRHKMHAYLHKCIMYTKTWKKKEKNHPMTKGLLTCRSQGRVCILDAQHSCLGASNCRCRIKQTLNPTMLSRKTAEDIMCSLHPAGDSALLLPWLSFCPNKSHLTSSCRAIGRPALYLQ